MDAEARYQRRLLVFLSVASFFEGYDFLALAQLLPNIRQSFGLSPTEGGALVTVVNAGTMIAYALVRAADRWGRKRVLSWTIAGYTISSFLSGLAPNIWLFAGAQLHSRIFLIGEWAIALVVAAEEFPAEKRGSAMHHPGLDHPGRDRLRRRRTSAGEASHGLAQRLLRRRGAARARHARAPTDA